MAALTGKGGTVLYAGGASDTGRHWSCIGVTATLSLFKEAVMDDYIDYGDLFFDACGLIAIPITDKVLVRLFPRDDGGSVVASMAF